MAVTPLKSVIARPPSENADLRDTVAIMLAAIELGGEAAARRYASQFDNWQGEIVLSAGARAKAVARVPQELQADIRFAQNNIQRFAEAQKATLSECEIELLPGHWAGQRQIPANAAGCYVPGGH